MKPSETVRLCAGDRVPPFVGLTSKGAVYALEEQAGRAVVLITSAGLSAPGLIPLLTAFSEHAASLSAREVDLVALIGEDVETVFEYDLINPSAVNLVGSLDGSIRNFLHSVGMDGERPEILLVDRNERVAAYASTEDRERAVGTIMSAIDGMPTEIGRDIFAPAPILLLPKLFSLDLCRELIATHLAGPNFESPVLYADNQNRPVHNLDPALKKRRDLLLNTDSPLHARVSEIIARRCVPEIKRAFQVNIGYTDRFLIACYPGDGGHFRRHRDDRPESVAFRRFALSINLTPSADGYEGGFLRLPEFNSHHYRCPPGGGLIFSVALLHEITPVTRGDRYVLVTHLHDDAGEAQRLAGIHNEAPIASA